MYIYHIVTTRVLSPSMASVYGLGLDLPPRLFGGSEVQNVGSPTPPPYRKTLRHQAAVLVTANN